MTYHHVEIMHLADGGGIVEYLLQVVVHRAGMRLHDMSSHRVKLSVELVIYTRTAAFVEVVCSVDSESESLHESDVGKSVKRISVTLGIALVEQHIHKRVGIGHKRTVASCVHSVTIVIYLIPIVVNHWRTVGIAQVKWIDRSHLCGECPDITCR